MNRWLLFSFLGHFALFCWIAWQIPLLSQHKTVSNSIWVRYSEIPSSPQKVKKAGTRNHGPRGVEREAVVKSEEGASESITEGESNPDSSTESSSVVVGYANLIRDRISSFLSYPLSLKRRGIQGRVNLKITLSPLGALQNCQIEQSSGYPELDQLALQAVADASPFEKIPSGQSLSLKLPIDFKLF